MSQARGMTTTILSHLAPKPERRPHCGSRVCKPFGVLAGLVEPGGRREGMHAGPDPSGSLEVTGDAARLRGRARVRSSQDLRVDHLRGILRDHVDGVGARRHNPA